MQKLLGAVCVALALAPLAHADELTATQRLCLTAPPGSEAFTRGYERMTALGAVGTWAPMNATGPSRVVITGPGMTMTLWDAASGARVAEIAPGEGYVSKWEVSPDGTRAVVARASDPAELWDLPSGRKLADLPYVRRDGGRILNDGIAEFSADGARLIAADQQGHAQLIDARTGRVLAELHPAPGYASYEFIGDRLLRQPYGGAAAELWANDGTLISSLTLQDGKALVDGTRVLSLREGGGWSLFDLASNRTLAQHEGEFAEIVHVLGQGARDGARSRNFFITQAFAEEDDPLDHKVMQRALWDAGTGRETLRFEGGDRDAIMAPNEVALLTRDGAGQAFLWDPRTGRRLARLGRFLRPSEIEEVFVTDESEPYSYFRLSDGSPPPFEFMFSRDGALLATRDRSGLGVLWNARTGEVVAQFPHMPDLPGLMFSPSANWIVINQYDANATLWSVRGARMGSLGKFGAYMPQPEFSPNEDYVAFVDGDWHVWLRRTRGAALAADLGNTQEFVFSPDGSRLLADHEVWDVARGVRLAEVGPGVVSFAMIDGRDVITTDDQFAYIAVTNDPATGEERRENVEPSYRIYDLDGHALGACSGATKWMVLETPAGQRVVTIDAGEATLWRRR